LADLAPATFSSLVKLGIRSALKEVHTALPGVVVDFDPATQRASVQPTIQRNFVDPEGNITPTDLPKLINVPVVFPQAGGFALTFPVQPGDEVLLVFAERSIDRWAEEGGVQNQAAKRFHSLSDAFAILGVNSKPNVVTGYATDGVEIRNEAGDGYLAIRESGEIEISAPGSVLVEGATTVTVKGATTVTVEAPSIILDGNVICTGLVTAQAGVSVAGGMAVSGAMTNNGVNVGSGHQHNQGPDSDGNTQQTTTAPI